MCQLRDLVSTVEVLFSEGYISRELWIQENSEMVVCVVNVPKVGATQSHSAKYKTADMHWLFIREICIPKKKGPTYTVCNLPASLLVDITTSL